MHFMVTLPFLTCVWYEPCIHLALVCAGHLEDEPFCDQAAAQWIEKGLPFLGILLIVFVRQHFLGDEHMHARVHTEH